MQVLSWNGGLREDFKSLLLEKISAIGTSDQKEIIELRAFLYWIFYNRDIFQDLTFSCVKNERPDFLIDLEDFSVGVELTSTKPRYLAKERVERYRRNSGGGWFFIDPDSISDKHPPNHLLARKISEGSNENTQPFFGYSIEDRMLEIIKNRIFDKIKKLPEYQKMDFSLLILSDGCGLEIDINYVTRMLHLDLADKQVCFDRIYIVDSSGAYLLYTRPGVFVFDYSF